MGEGSSRSAPKQRLYCSKGLQRWPAQSNADSSIFLPPYGSGTMPRKRIHSSVTTSFPDDFPQDLRRLKEASGLSWTELARGLRTYPLTIRRG